MSHRIPFLWSRKYAKLGEVNIADNETVVTVSLSNSEIEQQTLEPSGPQALNMGKAKESVNVLNAKSDKQEQRRLSESNISKDSAVIPGGSSSSLEPDNKLSVSTDQISLLKIGRENGESEVESEVMLKTSSMNTGSEQIVRELMKTFSKDDIDAETMKGKLKGKGLSWIYRQKDTNTSPSPPANDSGGGLESMDLKPSENGDTTSHASVVEDKCENGESIERSNSVSSVSAARQMKLATVLENLPLSYCPVTKSLQISSAVAAAKDIVDGGVHVADDDRSASASLLPLKPGMDEEVRVSSSASNSSCGSGQDKCAETKLFSHRRTGSGCSGGTETLPPGPMRRAPSFCYTDCSSYCGSLSSLNTDLSLSTTASLADDLDPETASYLEGNLVLPSLSSLERSRSSSICSEHHVMDLVPGNKPKRRGISNLLPRGLFFRKSSSKDTAATSASSLSSTSSSASSVTSTSGGSWRIFSRLPPKLTPTKELKETEAGGGSPRKVDVDVSSTTALILENRPSGLPAKSAEEELRHKQEYEAMVLAARKKELKESKLRKKQRQQQLKQEEFLSQTLKCWNEEILPHWDDMSISRKAKELWWHGIPPSIRGKVWKLAIGNDLNLTPELYEICAGRARERFKTSSSDPTLTHPIPDPSSSTPPHTITSTLESSISQEGSVELIKLDVSRTFPQLCIFQEGGPYYDLLHSLLGAYACYRPDVGYMQGMSFIAAIFILNMDVADAFICFSNLMNKPCQLAFFRLNETLMKAYFQAYDEFFQVNLPRLYEHFDKLDLTPDLYLIEWVYTMFAKSLPLDVACRVWDMYCRDGEEFLFRAALGILRLHQDLLVSMDFCHAAEYLTKLPDSIKASAMFKAINSIHMHIDKRRFNQVFITHRDAITKAKECS